MNKIKNAIKKLTPELKEKHKEALAEGYKDEVCKKCGTVLLAHHHFVHCVNARLGECPMVSKKMPKSLLDMMVGEEE